MQDYLVVIPARGGSKGIPKKNLYPIAGKPLIAWTIIHALETPAVGRVVLSTDDPEIADTAKSFGVEVPFLRPPELAKDDTPTEPCMIHAVEYLKRVEGYDCDAVILLQPTSPYRKPDALGKAITQYEADGADSLVSACEIHPFLWRNPTVPNPEYDVLRRPRRQDIPESERIYEENGSIYITRTDALMSHQCRLAPGSVSLFQMDKSESIDIDTLGDLEVVEAIMTQALSK